MVDQAAENTSLACTCPDAFVLCRECRMRADSKTRTDVRSEVVSNLKHDYGVMGVGDWLRRGRCPSCGDPIIPLVRAQNNDRASNTYIRKHIKAAKDLGFAIRPRICWCQRNGTRTTVSHRQRRRGLVAQAAPKTQLNHRDKCGVVPQAGLEPASLAAVDFESTASTNSATGAPWDWSGDHSQGSGGVNGKPASRQINRLRAGSAMRSGCRPNPPRAQPPDLQFVSIPMS